MEKPTPERIDNVARQLYEVYCRAVGGIAFNGDPLPSWEEFSKDASKLKQANGWRAVAEVYCKVNP